MLRRIHLTTLFLLLFSFFPVWGQQTLPDNFQPLTSAGKIPDDFLYNTARINNLPESERDTWWTISEVLHSGLVTFGDPVTNHLQEQVEKILSTNPEIGKSNIRAYTYNNAKEYSFAFTNGIIIVSTGLIAELETEEQLTYLLCREIAHITLGHIANNPYIGTDYLDKIKYPKTYAERIKRTEGFTYTKAQQIEADEKGIQYFRATGMEPYSLLNYFDVLYYAYLPVDDVKFPETFFNDAYYQVPAGYFLKEVSPITNATAITNEQKDLEERGKNHRLLVRYIPGFNEDDKSVDQTNFKSIQYLCLQQLCINLLSEHNFPEAFYIGYLLHTRLPESAFPWTVMGAALFDLATYRLDDKNRVDTSYMSISGESQQVYYFMEKIPADELLVLSLRICWKSLQMQPQNNLMLLMCKNAGLRLGTSTNKRIYTFYTSVNLKKTDTADTANIELLKPKEPDSTKAKQNKIDKIKQAKQTQIDTSQMQEEDYWKLAFINYLDNPDFKLLFKEKRLLPVHLPVAKKDRYQFALNTTKVAFIDPYYTAYDARKHNAIQYKENNKKKIFLHNELKRISDQKGLETVIISFETLTENDVELFNTLAVSNRWIFEELQSIHIGSDLIGVFDGEMTRSASTLGVDHFIWTGINRQIQPIDYIGKYILFGILIFPYAPFALWEICDVDTEMYFNTIAMDVETCNIDMYYYTTNRQSHYNSTITSTLYLLLDQIHPSRK